METELSVPDSEASISKKHKHNEDDLVKDLGDSANIVGSQSVSLNSENLNGSNSELSYHDDENDEDAAADDISDYDDNDDYIFDDNDDYDYLSVQAQFDNVDLPPGVEASFSWIKNPCPSPNFSISSSASGSGASLGLSMYAGLSATSSKDAADGKSVAVASSSSAVGSSGNVKEEEDNGEDVMRRYEHFQRFDIVSDFSDHHYGNVGFQGEQPPLGWMKKVQDEWKILEKDLPETIYVRVYETRMDLLRAVIVGSQGTPYHDGLFVFDVLFPPTYPDIPPMVYYYSGGLRLNPNLYDCGKVCLSLLNTWTGKGNEKWIPKISTMLQVLVSIQALILNANPFFNEPGYESTYVGVEGERKSKAYNEDVFILSLKTMMYTLRRPPKHFEDLVTGHFRSHAKEILLACKAYMEGAPVGSLVNGRGSDNCPAERSGSNEFRASLGRMMNGLVANFSRCGAKDCEQFRLQ